MFKQKLVFASMLLFLISCAIASTANGQTPTGREIAKAAKSLKLRPQDSTSAERDGMRVTLTPTDTSNVKITDMEKGFVIAVVDVVDPSGEGNGRYNLFVMKSRGHWRAFRESNGQVTEVKNFEATETLGVERIPDPHVVLTPVCSCGSICSGFGKRQVCFNACWRCL